MNAKQILLLFGAGVGLLSSLARAGSSSSSDYTITADVVDSAGATLQSKDYFMLATSGTIAGSGIEGTSGYVNQSGLAAQLDKVAKVAPNFTLTGLGTPIASGDTTPSVADGTDFGTVALLNSQPVRRFTIGNQGNSTLNLTGTPRVHLGGTAAADFKVTALPPASVPAGEMRTFDLSFDPAMPGSRTATVTIASDDPDTPSFTFTVTGFGALPTPLSQMISFAPPGAVYVGQSPLTVEATANSGLPVTFQIVGGPATLAGNVLTILGPGTIRVQALQAGGGNYRSAVPVVRSIVARPDPTSLTLTNLNQVYDGTPKEIGYVGTETASIFYTISGAEVDTAPVNAGSYRVVAFAGSMIKTGTLVIAKAPLTVTPDDQRKFAGQPNPVLTATITGFAGTDTAAGLTRPPVLATRASTRSPGGQYAITARGAADENYTFVYSQGTMVVETFAGSYDGLLRRPGDSDPVGKLEIDVASTSKTFSARLLTETSATVVGMSGPLTTNSAAEEAIGAVEVTKNGITHGIAFTIPLSGDSVFSATRNQVELGRTERGKKLAALKNVTYAGAHTAILQPAAPTADAVPEGAGWATASVSSAGRLTLDGRLADGTPFTAAASPDAGSDPGYRLFIQPYKPARSGTWVAGEFELKAHPDLPGRRYLESAALTWVKARRDLDTDYRAGFGPVTTRLGIDPWRPPMASRNPYARWWSLTERLGLVVPRFLMEAMHSRTGSASHATLPVSLTLTSRNTLAVLAPVTTPTNATKWNATVVPGTGRFIGSFELLDGSSKRNVPFSGVLRQAPGTSADGVVGDGHYLLPPLPGTGTTERRSGEIRFSLPEPD